MKQHEIGDLSPSGVLDVGRRCPHSCVFCFYSFYDGSDKQFNYLRKAPWVPGQQLKNILDHFVSWGLSHFDYTGGEPSLHPEILDITRYAHQELGLHGRMITLGQFLMKRLKGSNQLHVDDLIDAGLNDFLFSLHSLDPQVFNRITGGQVDALRAVMEHLSGRGFSFCTNSVVNNHTFETLPETAEYIAQHRVRIVNFIVMRMDWGLRNQPDLAVGHKGRYADVMERVKEAIDILDAKGIAANVRYAPYCSMKGYERHVVGYKGIQLDPYEWRNGTKAASEGEPFLKNTSVDDYYKRRVPMFEQDPVYNLAFGKKCDSCSLRPICDGVDRSYVEKHGWDEFEPFPGEKVSDIVHFRRDYAGPFQMKEAQFE